MDASIHFHDVLPQNFFSLLFPSAGMAAAAGLVYDKPKSVNFPDLGLFCVRIRQIATAVSGIKKDTKKLVLRADPSDCNPKIRIEKYSQLHFYTSEN